MLKEPLHDLGLYIVDYRIQNTRGSNASVFTNIYVRDSKHDVNKKAFGRQTFFLKSISSRELAKGEIMSTINRCSEIEMCLKKKMSDLLLVKD